MIQWLLDTNVVIWLSEDDPRAKKVLPLLSYTEAEFYISSVSWWEIAIKIRAGKLSAEYSELRSLANKYNFLELPLTSSYLDVYMELPKLHKDPYDHMLLAQAITSPMRFITGDKFLKKYSSLVMVI